MIPLQVLKLVFGPTEPDGGMNGLMDGWTDRRGSRNCYLDMLSHDFSLLQLAANLFLTLCTKLLFHHIGYIGMFLICGFSGLIGKLVTH